MTVSVGLFPDEFPDLHEIQGGEEKTHEVALFFHEGDAQLFNPLVPVADLLQPVRARPGYDESARTQALGNFGPRDVAAFPNWENTVEYIAFADLAGHGLSRCPYTASKSASARP